MHDHAVARRIVAAMGRVKLLANYVVWRDWPAAVAPTITVMVPIRSGVFIVPVPR